MQNNECTNQTKLKKTTKHPENSGHYNISQKMERNVLMTEKNDSLSVCDSVSLHSEGQFRTGGKKCHFLLRSK